MSRTYHRLRATLFVGFVVIAVFDVLFTAYEVHESREFHFEVAAREASSRAQTLGEHVGRTIGEIDRLLTDLRDDIALAERRDGFAGRPLRDYLARMAERSGQIRSMFAVTGEGAVVNLGAGEPAHAAVALELFKRSREAGGDETTMSSHSVDPDPNSLLSVARRLGKGPDAGIIGVTADFGYFRDFYSRLVPGRHGWVAVFDATGAVLASYPRALPEDKARAWAGALAGRTQAAEGMFDARLFDQREEFAVAYRRLRGLPLTVSVAHSAEDFLANWREEEAEQVALALVVLLALAGVLALLLRELRQAQRRESQLYLTQYSIDHAGDMIFWLDRDGRARSANETAGARLGLTPAAIQGRHLSELFFGPGTRYWPHNWAALLRDKRISLEAEGTDATGRRFPVDIALSLVRFEGEQLCCAVCRDISERKRAEEALAQSEKRFRAIFESTPNIAVQGYDREHRVIFWNRASERLFGYAADEAAGRRIEDLIVPAGDRDDVLARIDTWLAGGPSLPPGEATLRRKDGSAVHVFSSHALFVNSHGEPELYCTHIDLSDRLRAEQALRESADTLEARVHERTLELESALNELESFSYSVSHDLRSPLRALNGFATILLHDYGQRLDDQARDYLQRMRAAAERMSDLIDGLLELGRITRAPLKQTPADLGAIAAAIVQELREAEPQRMVDAVIEPNLAALADAVLLQSLMHNLLGNAWKYSSKRERTRIHVGRVRNQDETVFFVRDNGVGFDMAYADKLFGAFQRLHGRDEFEGIGIGLATARRIVGRHGGRIWAESTPGEGATFYFTLPGAEAARLADAA